MCFVEREDARTGDSALSGDPALSGNLAISGDPAGSGLKGAGGVLFTRAALGALPVFAGCPVGLLFFCEYVFVGEPADFAGGPTGWLSSLGTAFLGGTGLLFSRGEALLGVCVDSLIVRDDELVGERGTEKQTKNSKLQKTSSVLMLWTRTPAALREIEPKKPTNPKPFSRCSVRDQERCYSSLDWMLVQYKIPPAPAFCWVFSIVSMGVEGHCENTVACPGTEYNMIPAST